MVEPPCACHVCGARTILSDRVCGVCGAETYITCPYCGRETFIQGNCRYCRKSLFIVCQNEECKKPQLITPGLICKYCGTEMQVPGSDKPQLRIENA